MVRIARPLHLVGQDRTGVVRYAVDVDGARSALGAVAPQLGPGEPQLVAQGHRQRLVGEHVHSPLLAVDVQRHQPFHPAPDLAGGECAGTAEQVAGRGDGRARRDHALDELAAGIRSGTAVADDLDFGHGHHLLRSVAGRCARHASTTCQDTGLPPNTRVPGNGEIHRFAQTACVASLLASGIGDAAHRQQASGARVSRIQSAGTRFPRTGKGRQGRWIERFLSNDETPESAAAKRLRAPLSYWDLIDLLEEVRTEETFDIPAVYPRAPVCWMPSQTEFRPLKSELIPMVRSRLTGLGQVKSYVGLG